MGSSEKELTLDDVDTLFCTAEWQPILLEAREDWTDRAGRFSVLSMLRALALPFLLPISSEHALARELEEKKSVAALCGFLGKSVPTRAMLWHFRMHPSRVYPRNMPRVLAILAIAGEQLGLSLPFVRKNVPRVLPDAKPSLQFWLPCSRTTVELWQMGVGSNLCLGTKRWDRLPLFPEEVSRLEAASSSGDGLVGELGLPVLMRLSEGRERRLLLELVKPEWLNFKKPVSDPLSSIAPSHRVTPYVVVHGVVTRGYGNNETILMGISSAGSARGTYTLPGGTLQNGEKLSACLEREVSEETGLRVRKSVPVSFFFTQFEDRPWVLNIVAKVQEYDGHLENREKHNFDSWAWLPITGIPRQISLDVFRPALIAIEHYHRDRDNELLWENFEEDVAGTRLETDAKAPKGVVPFPAGGASSVQQGNS